MNYASLCKLLEQEHEQINKELESISHSTLASALFHRVGVVISSLKRHIYVEEELLFPFVQSRNPGLFATINMLEIEHGSMWSNMDELTSASPLDTGRGHDLNVAIELLLDMQYTHDPKEERIIYNTARLLASDVSLPDISQLPQNWTCAALRM